MRFARVHYFSKRYQGSWTSQRIRSTFLDYFKSHGHAYVAPSSIIPRKDEGSCFVNAGMNQFKPIFLGTADQNSSLASLKRAVNSQKCIRVGGKHNDLDDVGRDTYHHTFFEMLGSWSFGDYFKKEACKLAWEALTDIYGLNKNCLYVTYFAGSDELGLKADEETKHIWLDIGVSPERILPFGISDNFWSMGDTGPCGPCTEIHYDHRARSSAQNEVNSGSPDVIELWNLVFMQYDRQHDGTLRPLPRHHVDTGMGLERLCAVMQGSRSNYDTDLFQPIFKEIEQRYHVLPYTAGLSSSDLDIAYRTVADHVRMCTVAVSDGLLPGKFIDSQKRLRVVMQRMFKLVNRSFGAERFSAASLVPVVVASLGDAFPELRKSPSDVMDVINASEHRYWQMAEKARDIVPKAIKKYELKACDVLSGEQLYEIMSGRFGLSLPMDIIEDIAADFNIYVDVDGYTRHVQQLSESQGHTVIDNLRLDQYDIMQLEKDSVSQTDDSYKYDLNTECDSLSSRLSAILTQSGFCDRLAAPSERCGLLLDKTNFYAEGGGQVSDIGTIEFDSGAVFRVDDVQAYGRYMLHVGKLLEGAMSTGDTATLKPDVTRRAACAANHSATHLLNHALLCVLGETRQHSSLVRPDKLSFHFSTMQTQPLSNKVIGKLQTYVNDVIAQGVSVCTGTVPLADIRRLQGVRTLEHVTYPKQVRVVSVGKTVDEIVSAVDTSLAAMTSVELCGGTHVEKTSDIGPFVITNVTGGHQGIRGIVALTGDAARKAFERGQSLLDDIASLRHLIASKQQPDQWTPMFISIQDRFGASRDLEKETRDEVSAAIKELRHVTSPRAVAKSTLAAVIRACVSAAPAQSVHVIHSLDKQLKNPREVIDCIANNSFDGPLCVSVKHRNMSFVVCYLPQDHPQSCEAWGSRLSKLFSDTILHAPVGKNANDDRFRVVLVTSKQPVDFELVLTVETVNGLLCTDSEKARS